MARFKHRQKPSALSRLDEADLLEALSAILSVMLSIAPHRFGRCPLPTKLRPFDQANNMRIDQLHVQNFKGFEELHLAFPRADDPAGAGGSFHLLIGQNGTGKTSALDALAVAAGAWLLGIPDCESRTIRAEDVRLRVIDYRDTQRIEPQLPTIVEAVGEILGQSLHWRRIRRLERTDRAAAKDIRALAERAVAEKRRGEPTTLPVVLYYGTGRSWQEPREPFRRKIGMDMDVSKVALAGIKIKSGPDGSEPNNDAASAPSAGADRVLDPAPGEQEQPPDEEFASTLAGYRRGIDPYCNPDDLLRWLRLEQQLAVQERAESTQFKVVKQAILQAVPGCRRVDYHLRLGLLLEIAGQGRLPFGTLSHGQRNMIAMIGDLAWRAAQLNPHLGPDVLQQTPGVVLIDELELHLHPRWQREVVLTLRDIFPAVQFIATTHSPQIVGHLPPRYLQLLIRDPEGRIRAAPVPQSLGMDSNWILEQIMDTPDREPETQRKLAAIFTAIDNEDFPEASAQIRDLERAVGRFPDLQGARAMLDRLEILLGDEKDS